MVLPLKIYLRNQIIWNMEEETHFPCYHNFLSLYKVRILFFDDGKVRGVELFAGLNVFDGDKRYESKESLVGALVVNIRQKQSQILVEGL